MEKCDICGKECKTGQGLAGHKRWVHGVGSSSAQLRLEQPNPLITKSVLEQVLDERFAVISEQVDTLSGELEQLAKCDAELQERLSAAERKGIGDFTPGEKAEFIIPWMQGLDAEDFVRLALETGHEAQLVEVNDPAVVSVLAETFRKQAEEETILPGKTDRPGYKYLEYLNLSVRAK